MTNLLFGSPEETPANHFSNLWDVEDIVMVPHGRVEYAAITPHLGVCDRHGDFPVRRVRTERANLRGGKNIDAGIQMQIILLCGDVEILKAFYDRRCASVFKVDTIVSGFRTPVPIGIITFPISALKTWSMCRNSIRVLMVHSTLTIVSTLNTDAHRRS